MSRTSEFSGSSSVADSKASGAADRMWQKVEEDLERIDKAPIDEDEDD